MFDHDVVAVDETAQFFAVASVNGGQITVAVVVVAIWQRSSEKQKPRVYVRSVYALFNSSIISIYIRNILIFK